MSLWEYKVISSGKGGFATPALLEKFLNDLGRDEWDIIDFRSSPDNALAFTGLARRSTQRDWTLEDAAAAAAKVEAEKLRVEFSAKFQAASSATTAAEDKAISFLEEKAAPDDGFRKPVDTSHDSEPESAEEQSEKDEWDKLSKEDELPSFFDALKPHMRRNQRGPGMSVGTDYLAKKWELAEEDVKGALVECGMQIPADENAKPVYVEYDGDLFWVNINRRGEIWINTREKPRPVFRVVQATKVAPDAIEEPKPENGGSRSEEPREPRERREGRPTEASEENRSADAPRKTEPAIFQPKSGGRNQEPKPQAVAVPLPTGLPLLEKIRPLMRRNRRGPGGSGSASFLARAFKCTEADLMAGFQTLNLVLPATPADQPLEIEIAGDIWWLNQDSRGGLWINGREKRDGEVLGAQKTDTIAPVDVGVAPAEPATLFPLDPAAPVPLAPAPTVAPDGVFTAVRLLLQETKTGSFAGKVIRVAGDLGKSPDDLTASLVAAGLKLPEKPREKPVFIEQGGEIFWLNRNAKGELWVNAKASKFGAADEASDGDLAGGSAAVGEKKTVRRPSSRPKKSADQ